MDADFGSTSARPRLRPLARALLVAGLFATAGAGAFGFGDQLIDRVAERAASVVQARQGGSPVAGSLPALALSPAVAATDAVGGPVPASAGVGTDGALRSANAAGSAVPIAPIAAPNYRAIVERFGPSVVGINVAGTRPVAANPGTDPMQQFFRGLPGFPQPRGDAPFRGQGSGFIVSSDGLVLTNAHVVRDAKEVNVKLQDRTEHRARVLGIDPATDIAVLKIDATGLPAVVLGDPSQVRVGFEQSATQGIVSAKGRALPGDSRVPFIQTDAAVNPGNSGGPLFDGAGRVIGINSQIYSSSGGFQGLAFAIPIDVAMRIKDQIVATGRVDHARLGVVVQDLDQALAESFGLPRPNGAVISAVQPGGPAALSGLKPGDVVTRIGDQPVNTAGELSQRIGQARPGERLKLQVWRERSAREVVVQLQSASPAAAEAGPAPAGQGGAVPPSVRRPG
jgi:serine protease Do